MGVAMNENNINVVLESARDAAIDWWLRRNDGPLSKKEEAEFNAWLAREEANKAAFDKVAAMCGIMAQHWPGARPVRKARRSRRKAAAAAITGAVAVFAVFSDLPLYLRSDHYAGTGETKLVTLDDGSHLELDAKSAITVRYSAGERRLTLLEGEAWFEVAPDPARPFVVEAAGGTVTALGTAFNVAVENERAQVTVMQHRVSVVSGGQTVIVEEGQQSAYAKSAAAKAPHAANSDQATAWRRGRLMFENRPLGEVVEALGRYHHGYVYFTNAALLSRRVTGVFRTDDPLAALDEIEISLGLHATHLSNYLIVIYE
jgi:transmembrane sensor